MFDCLMRVLYWNASECVFQVLFDQSNKIKAIAFVIKTGGFFLQLLDNIDLWLTFRANVLCIIYDIHTFKKKGFWEHPDPILSSSKSYLKPTQLESEKHTLAYIFLFNRLVFFIYSDIFCVQCHNYYH